MSDTPKVTVRPATARDADAILTLVNELAVQQVMLPRSPASVIENLRDFAIAEVDGAFAGCGALAITWTDLAEVRSLAVHPAHQKHGIGRAIVDWLVTDAERLGINRLFAFTYVPDFFEKLSFVIAEHEELPHKVFNDCMHCPKFLACDEIAMTRVLDENAAGATMQGNSRHTFPLPIRTTKFGAPGATATPGLPQRPQQAPPRPDPTK
ncbi:MAG TPA: N-acetyltransferase [Planctomycetes bacterium]|nr:N-acetyltransferase [Planctomycetota bacterium]